MFQWNKLELFWTSTFEVNAKGNCCNAFGTVLVVIKTNGHRLNLFIQIFNFQNIYFPKLIYVHWSCSSFKKPILTWNVVVFVVQLRKSLSLSLYLHVINSFMPLIYGLFPDVQNEDVHSVQKNRRCFNMLRPQLFRCDIVKEMPDNERSAAHSNMVKQIWYSIDGSILRESNC